MSINSLSKDEYKEKVKPLLPRSKVKGNARKQQLMSELDDRQFRKMLEREIDFTVEGL